MPGTMVEKLQLVVDATTGAAEARFGKLTQVARETGDASVRSASAVATAADRVAAAQLKAADEAGKLRVAQQRLQDLQEKGNATATQLAGAEEKVAGSQRRLHLATREVVAATDAQIRSQAEAEVQAQDTGQAQGQLAGHLDTLRGKVAGLVAGGALVSYLRGATNGFLDGARGAATLATSMNATIAQGGQLSQLLASVGLDAADVLEIQAEFAQKIAANSSALAEFGAEVKRNDDGTTNWALTLEDALVNLQQIPDATERNRRGFALFGEEGYKQLSRLLNSGASVRDALEQIGTPFSDEDVAATREYDAAMLRLQLTTGSLGRTIGREVVPVLTGLVDGFGTVASVVTAIPGPIALTTAAAIAMGVTGFNPAAAAGARLATVMAAVRAEVAVAGGAMLTSGVAATVLGAGMSAASAAGGRMMALAGGPLGVALVAAGTAFYFASEGSKDLEKNANDAALELEKVEGSAAKVSMATSTAANDLEEHAGYWERSAAYVRGYQEDLDGVELAAAKLIEPFQRLTMGFGDTADTAQGFELAIEDARRELGEFGAQQALAQAAQFTLTELIAQGKTSGEEYAAAVVASADAQARQASTAGLAEAAVAALRAVTDQAYLSQLNLINAELGRNDATYAFLDAMDAANAAVDDEKTSVDEVAQAHDNLKGKALGAAQAAADAAVAAATANGTVLTELTEAQIRADAVISDLQARLATPGLGDQAKADIQGIIDRLTTAKDNGTITAELQTLGVDEAAGELDAATQDREAIVKVESRGGPAVQDYLDGLANRERLAIVRVESRNGPAVGAYLDSLTAERLAIIRVETRGGPAVQRYLDDLAGADRTAVIGVRSNGAAPAVFGAPAVAGRYGAGGGDVIVQSLAVTVQADSGGRVTSQSAAEGGRQVVQQLAAYTRQNGPGWLNGLQR